MRSYLGNTTQGGLWLLKAVFLTSPVEVWKHTPSQHYITPSLTKVKMPWWEEQRGVGWEGLKKGATDNLTHSLG